MSTPTREPCKTCDRPEASTQDYETHGYPNPDICWSRFMGCRGKAVDWRARCLQAESTLALLSTPLSPEALQVIAEESAE